jgi:hypothetical protein
MQAMEARQAVKKRAPETLPERWMLSLYAPSWLEQHGQELNSTMTQFMREKVP